MSTPSRLLSVRHVTTGYGKKQVLTDVTFDVDAGEIVLLTGGNGSGKSTVLKTIHGLLAPWNPEAKITFVGEDITARPASEMLRRGIAYMPQKKNVFEDFTAEENLLTAASIYSATDARQRMENVFAQLPALAALRKRTPFHMSGGERQLLAFGNALVHSQKLLLLDEPFAGVDETNATEISKKMGNLNKQGITFVIVEHKKQYFQGILDVGEIQLKLGTIHKKTTT